MSLNITKTYHLILTICHLILSPNINSMSLNITIIYHLILTLCHTICHLILLRHIT